MAVPASELGIRFSQPDLRLVDRPLHAGSPAPTDNLLNLGVVDAPKVTQMPLLADITAETIMYPGGTQLKPLGSAIQSAVLRYSILEKGYEPPEPHDQDEDILPTGRYLKLGDKVLADELNNWSVRNDFPVEAMPELTGTFYTLISGREKEIQEAFYACETELVDKPS